MYPKHSLGNQNLSPFYVTYMTPVWREELKTFIIGAGAHSLTFRVVKVTMASVMAEGGRDHQVDKIIGIAV